MRVQTAVSATSLQNSRHLGVQQAMLCHFYTIILEQAAAPPLNSSSVQKAMPRHFYTFLRTDKHS